MQPYYAIGQWRLPTGCVLRAFVCSRQGALHIVRVAGERGQILFVLRRQPRKSGFKTNVREIVLTATGNAGGR